MSKSAMQELIEKLENIQTNDCKSLQERIFFDGVLAVVESFLQKEKEQILKAFDNGAIEYESHGERDYSQDISSEQYYNQNYKTE